MSLSTIASRLYDIRNVRNVPLTTAFLYMAQENLAARFSTLYLIRALLTSKKRSSLLQKDANPEERKALKEDQQYKEYAASSISRIANQLSIVSAATERNTALINMIMSDLGYFRGQKKFNVMRSKFNARAYRAPVNANTVKGKIDLINLELEKLREAGTRGMGIAPFINIKRRPTSKSQEKNKDAKQLADENSILSKSIKYGLLGMTSALGTMLGTATLPGVSSLVKSIAKQALGSAVPLLGVALRANIAYKLIQSVSKRSELRSKTGLGVESNNPYPQGSIAHEAYNAKVLTQDKLSAKYDPIILGVGSYMATNLGIGAVSTISPMIAASQSRRRMKNFSELRRQARTRSLVQRMLFGIGDKSLEQRAAERATRFARANRTLRGKIRTTLSGNPKIVKIGKWINQTKIGALGKKLAPVTVASLIYQYSQIKTLDDQYRSGTSGLTYADYKNQMSSLLGKMTIETGAGTVGGMLGFVLGEAIFPPGGGLIGALAGAGVGAIGSFAATSLMEGGSTEQYFGDKLFSLLFENGRLNPPSEANLPSGGTSTPNSSTTSSGGTSTPNMGGIPSGGTEKGLENNADFISEVNRVSEKFNIDSADLLAVMYKESGLDPAAVNSTSQATGLIQFMPETAKSLGTSVAQLKQMNAVEQMKYVEKYFDSVNLPKTGVSRGELYGYVFMPARVKDGVLAKQGTNAYRDNIGLDVNNDGVIDVNDLNAATMGEAFSPSNMAQMASAISLSNDSGLSTSAQILKMFSAKSGIDVLPPPPPETAATTAAQSPEVVTAQIQATAATILAANAMDSAKVLANETASINQRTFNNENKFAFVDNPTIDEYYA